MLKATLVFTFGQTEMMHPALKTSEVETGKVEEDIVNNILKDATNAWQEIV